MIASHIETHCQVVLHIQLTECKVECSSYSLSSNRDAIFFNVLTIYEDLGVFDNMGRNVPLGVLRE